MIYNVKKEIRSISHRNKYLRQIYLIANKVKTGLLSGMSDEKFARLNYLENTGRKLDLENPLTFNEKLWWLKLNNKNPLLTVCTDKYLVRGYVRDSGLGDILTNLYGVYNNADEIQFNKLPDKVFIKTNHGSGTNIIYDKNKPFDIAKFRKEFNHALKQNYYYHSREWNYKNIKPRIICEEVLGNKDNAPFVDYKFLCFDGRVKLVFTQIGVCADDGSHSPLSRRNVYDRDFNYLDIKVGKEHFDISLVSKPKNYEKMIEYAEILSEPFPHCRVDLYNIDGKIYFGELTFYHGGGNQEIAPSEWDRKMGDWIDLKSEKIVPDA